MGVPFKAKNGLDANSNKIVNVANPTTAQDAATKIYVDNAVGTGLPSQTGNNGKFLTTNGTTASWSLVPVGGISATGTPSSTTYLRGDGTWATVTSGSGDVVGPASSTDNAVVRFDGTTGKLIQNSTVTLSDTGVLTVPELSTTSITSTGNNPIVIAPDGTGDVHLNADSIRIGDNNLDAKIVTRGTGDLILTTHEDSTDAQGIIRIYDGANQNITINPSGTGNLGVGTSSPAYKLDVNGSVGISGITTVSNYLNRVTGNGNAAWLQQDGTGRSSWYWNTLGGSSPTYTNAGEDASAITLHITNNGNGGTFFLRSASGVGKNAGDAISWTTTLYSDLNNFTWKNNVILRADNYTSYSPSLTGSGASGTWAINVTGYSTQVNLGNDSTKQLLGSAWAGGSGYPGYQFTGGNSRFGFSSTGGVVDVYADGNFYATDNSYLVLHTANYNSYAPTLTGTGASGTWGISISGNAANVTGTVAVANGGTGLTTLTAGYIPYGNGTSAFGSSANLFWDSANARLGVGTTSPVSKLTVNGHANIIGGNSLYFNLDSGSTAHGQIFDDGNFHIHSINSSAMWINSPNGTGVYINNQATGNVYLANQGSVSIGGTDIYEKLNVRGQARLHTSNPYLLFRNESYPTIWGSRIRVTDYGDGMGINFDTSDSSDNWGTRMVVRHNGNVGVATTTPAYKLDVNGTARTTGRFYSNEWIQFDNFSALYSPHNGAHFLPNASSYGSWKVEGQRNGWCGLEFATTSNGNVSLMIRPDAIETGFHNNSNGWQLRWNGGTLYCHKGTYGGGTVATVLDSSNYSSYALPLSGGTITGSIYATSNNSGGEFYSYGWFRNYNSGTGIYNQATGNHFYSDGGYWNVAYGGTQGIRFRNGHAGAILGYLYAETSGWFGLLNNQGNWGVAIPPNGAGVFLYGTEVNVNQTLYVHEGANRTRVPRTFVQSSTPTGTLTNGDIWIQF